MILAASQPETSLKLCTPYISLRDIVSQKKHPFCYAKPTLSFNGVALNEVGKGVLDPDDAGYLSSYEYIFELPFDITDTTSELRLKVNAKSSINPDVDIVLKPVAESYWVDGTTVKRSIFKTDGTEVLTTARTITLDIS